MTNDEDRRTIEIDLENGWMVEMLWPDESLQGGPIALAVRPADGDDVYPPGGLSSTVLRGINFADAAEVYRRKLNRSERSTANKKRYEEARLDRIRNALAEGISDEYLSQLASIYLAWVREGRQKPTEALAEELGKSHQTIKGHLWQAKKRELMTGSAGRKGGALTPKASEILERVVPGNRKRLGDTS